MKNTLTILTAITVLATTSFLSAEPDKPMPNSEIKVELAPFFAISKVKGHGEDKASEGAKGNEQHDVKSATEKAEEAVPAAPAKKWLVPAAMSVHVRNLEKSIASFESEKAADHAALAISIDKDLKQMIASCTMAGEAHETLHDWLAPFLELATEYANATELAVQKEKIVAMRGAFSTFHEKFELSPAP